MANATDIKKFFRFLKEYDLYHVYLSNVNNKNKPIKNNFRVIDFLKEEKYPSQFINRGFGWNGTREGSLFWSKWNYIWMVVWCEISFETWKLSGYLDNGRIQNTVDLKPYFDNYKNCYVSERNNTRENQAS